MPGSSTTLRFSGSVIIKALLFLVVAYIPFFLHLGYLPVRVWDEARLIANTLEMARNGNFLVPHFDGYPDMWNTKPPLMIWFQLLFLKLIGNEEIAYRLPSAIAGFSTALIVLLLFVKYIKNFWFGFIAVLILITANGFVGEHVARTGDYDALLTFFTSLYALSFFLFVESGKQKFLHLFFAGLVLAVLTKSVQGLLFLPALAIYLLITKNLLKSLKNKWLYIDFLIASLIIAGYYILRESVNPGYFDAVISNELSGRYIDTTENHRHGMLYYVDLLYNQQFGVWLLFVPMGILTGLFLKKGIVKRLVIYSTSLVVFYLLVISLAGTKLAWYDAPLYPFLAILAAVVVFEIYTLLSEAEFAGKSKRFNLLPYILLFAFFIVPYQQIFNKVYKPKETESAAEFYLISHFLKDAVKGKQDISDCYICYDGYYEHLKYYTDRLNANHQNVRFIDAGRLNAGDLVLVSQLSVQSIIEKTYLTEEVGSHYSIKTYRINGTRN